MKRVITIILLAMVMAIGFEQQCVAQSADPTKTEYIYTKNSDGLEQYKLICLITYDDTLTPKSYTFGLGAQNERYKHIQDNFTIFAGNAEEMYKTLSMIYDFAENFKENEVKVPKGDITLMNYKLPMFGWYTLVETINGYHNFKAKDFKKIIEKFEKFCKKNNVIYISEQ